MIKRNGAFITYGPEDFVPGHSEYCSYQLGDPKECPVCKPNKSRRAKALVAVAGAAALASCATPTVVKDRVIEVKVPVAIQPITPAQVPAVPKPLGPRPPSLSAAADTLLAAHCEFVAYALKADPLIRLSAGLPPLALPTYPECEP